MELPTLDEIVSQALQFFIANRPPQLDLESYNLPFVVGSGNALSAGKIIFSGKAAIFADESDFKSLVKSYTPAIKSGLVKEAVVISASGEKDSVWETELAKAEGLHTILLTCKPNSSAAKLADKVLTFRSIAEPYTYNTSTYLGMILATTKENPEQILQLIKEVVLPKNFGQYKSYAFVLPDKYINIGPMLNIKADELFGPHLMLRAFTSGHARHAKFVHPWSKELVINLDIPNEYFGHPEHRWNLELPSFASYGTVMALTYHICGKIQALKPPYFRRNIKNFCSDFGPKAYGKPEIFEVMVPAN